MPTTSSTAGGHSRLSGRTSTGATFGGPLVKDRMFYFGSYEGTRIREKLTRLSIIPTPEQIRGDFSGIAQIYDPASQAADGTRLRFENDRLPADRIDPRVEEHG